MAKLDRRCASGGLVTSPRRRPLAPPPFASNSATFPSSFSFSAFLWITCRWAVAHTGAVGGVVAPGDDDQGIKAAMEAQEENKEGTRGNALMWISFGVCAEVL